MKRRKLSSQILKRWTILTKDNTSKDYSDRGLRATYYAPCRTPVTTVIERPSYVTGGAEVICAKLGALLTQSTATCKTIRQEEPKDLNIEFSLTY